MRILLHWRASVLAQWFKRYNHARFTTRDRIDYRCLRDPGQETSGWNRRFSPIHQPAMADISPMSVIDAPEFDYTSVKRKVLAGEDFPARKLQRGPNSRFLPQLASLQNLSKIINHVKYDASISRVSIKHSLKSQLYAAMGQIPRQKVNKGRKT